MRERNVDVPEDRRIEFRIGINLGDIIVEDNDIYGDGVNVAARIESIASRAASPSPASVRDNVGNRLDLAFEDMGEQTLKNIDRPVASTIVNCARRAPRRPTAPQPELARTEKPSIAVLPFTNMSGDPEQEYFSDGITEDIITDLSKISGLHVVARNTVFTYKGKPSKVQQAAQELGVKLRARRQRPQGRPARAHHRPADRRQETAAISGPTATTAISPTSSPSRTRSPTPSSISSRSSCCRRRRRRSSSRRPTNVEAYTHYLRGRQFFHTRTKDPPATRAAHVRQGGRARSELCARLCRHRRLRFASCMPGMASRSRSRRSLATCAKALALDPNLAEAHASRGLALSTPAERNEAPSPNSSGRSRWIPNSYEGHYFYARHSLRRRRLRKGRRALRSLHRNSSPTTTARRCCSANALARRSGAMTRRRSYATIGLERAERALELHPENSDPAQLGAIALRRSRRARAGQGVGQLALWRSIRTISSPGTISPASIRCSAMLDRAIDLLETFLAAGGTRQHEAMVQKRFRSRSHPRPSTLSEAARSDGLSEVNAAYP